MAHLKLKEHRPLRLQPIFPPNLEAISKLKALGFEMQREDQNNWTGIHPGHNGVTRHILWNSFGYITAWEKPKAAGDEVVILFQGRLAQEKELGLLLWQIEWLSRHPDALLPEGEEKRGTKDEIIWV